MAQFFPRSSNTIVRVVLLGAALLVAAAASGAFLVFWSPVVTQVGVPIEQPVPFSHQHHVSGLGIDCRYCHASVETSRFAGMPSTETCMTCHSQVWRDAPVLEPVRASWREGKPLRWVRVHDLPDYTYFNHQPHVAKGVACVSCHGAVAEMPLVAKAENLTMRWCLDCHRHPEKGVGPREQIFETTWAATKRGKADGALPAAHHNDATRLMDCSTCHR